MIKNNNNNVIKVEESSILSKDENFIFYYTL